DGARLWIAEFAVRSLRRVIHRLFAGIANQDEPAIHPGHLANRGLYSRIAGRSINNVAAGIAGTPQPNPFRVALLFSVDPVDDVEQVRRLIEWIDDFANFRHFGGNRLARLAARQGLRG